MTKLGNFLLIMCLLFLFSNFKNSEESCFQLFFSFLSLGYFFYENDTSKHEHFPD